MPTTAATADARMRQKRCDGNSCAGAPVAFLMYAANESRGWGPTRCWHDAGTHLEKLIELLELTILQVHLLHKADCLGKDRQLIGLGLASRVD